MTAVFAEPLVECHSGFTYAESPRALRWDNARRVVKTITAQARQPGSRCFRIITEDDLTFDLSYMELSDTWSLNPV